MNSEIKEEIERTIIQSNKDIDFACNEIDEMYSRGWLGGNLEIVRILEKHYGKFIDDDEIISESSKRNEQTDGDLISRVKDIIRNDTYLSEAQVIDLLRRIDELPSTEKTAEWISHEEDDLAINDYQCSKCDYWTEYNTKYCPNCGAKMKESEEEE